jgi:hypothetical protein
LAQSRGRSARRALAQGSRARVIRQTMPRIRSNSRAQRPAHGVAGAHGVNQPRGPL